MNCQKIFALFISAVFFCCLYAGCSGKKDSDDLYERIRNQSKNPKTNPYTAADEARRQEQLTIADACLEKFTSCVEKCTDAACEERCSNAMSVCEKDLPADLRTMKK